ncbi:RHS repeat-associated core domain-containing protein, partial [Burkholderia sp. MSMB2041]
FASSRIDARLLSADETPNFAYVTSVAGGALCTVSVDAGTSWALADIDGRPVWAHDARGTTATWTYDVLGRPLTAEEAVAGQAPATREVWVYGEREADAQAHNLRGQCMRRYDAAGLLTWSGFRLTGEPVGETRQLPMSAEDEADWVGNDESAWAGELDPTLYKTVWTHDATGAWCTQVDAKGNVQARAHDVAGQLASSSLTLAGDGTAQPVLRSIEYSAAGQVLSEMAGNGVMNTYAYEPETQRLIGARTTRPDQARRATVLQDLHYAYDPVGNVLSVHNDAQTTTYWRNQQIEPVHTYAYDALYQLTGATGRETANRGQDGPLLPAPAIPLDDTVYTNYERTYTYDRSGNLTHVQHRGAARYTKTIVVSGRSNRAIEQNDQQNLKPEHIDDGDWFDAAGNQRILLPDRLQPLDWNGDNRLARVTLVKRDGTTDDCEVYQYGADGTRVRKQTRTYTAGTKRTQTSGTIRIAESIYLPGLTLRVTRSESGQGVKVIKVLHEVKLEAGQMSARTLHWESGQPDGLVDDAIRYEIGGLTSSIGLELDQHAEIISREEYYPYGGTAVVTARSQAEADTKYNRYSGKERDATGLYDYGLRYYQPWIGRWLNADPAGLVDGLNLFGMVRNNPVTYEDVGGLAADVPVSGQMSLATRLARVVARIGRAVQRLMKSQEDPARAKARDATAIASGAVEETDLAARTNRPAQSIDQGMQWWAEVKTDENITIFNRKFAVWYGGYTDKFQGKQGVEAMIIHGAKERNNGDSVLVWGKQAEKVAGRFTGKYTRTSKGIAANALEEQLKLKYSIDLTKGTTPFHLISCYAKRGAAQQVADSIDRPVVAYSKHPVRAHGVERAEDPSFTVYAALRKHDIRRLFNRKDHISSPRIFYPQAWGVASHKLGARPVASKPRSSTSQC